MSANTANTDGRKMTAAISAPKVIKQALMWSVASLSSLEQHLEPERSIDLCFTAASPTPAKTGHKNRLAF